MLLLIDSYKEYLNLELSNTNIDIRLTSLINAVESKLQRFLNRQLEKQNYTELYDGTGTQIIMTEQFPVNSVSKIEEWDGTSWDELFLDIDYDRQVVIRGSNEIYLEGFLFADGIQNYRITYNAGYEFESKQDDDFVPGNIPDDIKLALKKLCKIYYDESGFGDSRLGLLSKTKGVQGGASSWNFDTEAVQKALKEIEGYGQVNVGNFR